MQKYVFVVNYQTIAVHNQVKLKVGTRHQKSCGTTKILSKPCPCIACTQNLLSKLIKQFKLTTNEWTQKQHCNL